VASSRSAAVAAPTRKPRTRRPPAAPKQPPARRAGAKPGSGSTEAASRARRRPSRRARSRGAILCIAVSALLLAGVVFVNLAVLQLNLRVNKATEERGRLRAANATLQSQLSAALASPRIQALARKQDGLTEADPSTIGYLDLRR
jgi:hypothetical protein